MLVRWLATRCDDALPATVRLGGSSRCAAARPPQAALRSARVRSAVCQASVAQAGPSVHDRPTGARLWRMGQLPSIYAARLIAGRWWIVARHEHSHLRGPLYIPVAPRPPREHQEELAGAAEIA